MTYRIWKIEKHTTEILNWQVFSKAGKGITLDVDFPPNCHDITPDEEWEFENEADAREFFSHCSNDRRWNSGIGMITEFFLGYFDIDEDGNMLTFPEDNGWEDCS